MRTRTHGSAPIDLRGPSAAGHRGWQCLCFSRLRGARRRWLTVKARGLGLRDRCEAQSHDQLTNNNSERLRLKMASTMFFTVIGCVT